MYMYMYLSQIVQLKMLTVHHIYTLSALSQSDVKQSAEVAAYFNKFEEAEKMYLEMDRRYKNSYSIIQCGLIMS